MKETESPTETIGCVSGFHNQRQFIKITKEHWFSYTDSKHIAIWSPSAVLEPTSKTKCRTAALVLYIYNLSTKLLPHLPVIQLVLVFCLTRTRLFLTDMMLMTWQCVTFPELNKKKKTVMKGYCTKQFYKRKLPHSTSESKSGGAAQSHS